LLFNLLTSLFLARHTNLNLSQKVEELKEKGNAAFGKGNYLTAITQYTSALARDPNNHVLYSNRCAASLKLEKWTSASLDADRCIQIKPDWPKGKPPNPSFEIYPVPNDQNFDRILIAN